MNDDELGEFLRSEVPEPGPGYWDAIDARIAAAAAERDTAANVAAEIDATPQTDADVIRLTDMNTLTAPSSISRTPWLLAAAAAVVLLAVGAFAIRQTSDTPTELDTVTPPDDTGLEDPPSDPVPPIDGTADDTADEDDDEISDVSPGPDDAWDGTLTDIGAPGVWLAAGDTAIDVQLLPGDDQGEAAASAARPDVLFGTGNGAVVDGVEWVEVLWGPELTFGVFVRGSDVVRLGDRLDPTEPTVVGFGTDGVEVRDWPDADAPVRFLGAPEVTIERTGERVVVDGVEWLQLVEGIDRPATWVPAESVVAVDDAVGSADDRRSCYRDGTDVLVLDFADDAETFVGGFVFGASIETVDGVRDVTAGSVFDVRTSAIGSAEEDGAPIVVEERWTATADGLSVGDRAFLEPVGCDEVADVVQQLEALLGLGG